MTKRKIALCAVLGAALLGGAAQAQEYQDNSGSRYDRPYYADQGYDQTRTDARYDNDRYYGDAGETVIVRPDYDRVEKRQLLGRVNGEVNPTEFSLSRPVSFSDLDLTNRDDRAELRERVRDTARDLCAELDSRYPDLRGDSSADRECVRNATRDAMRDVLDGRAAYRVR